MSSEVIVAFITGILGPVLLLLIKHYFDKNKKKDKNHKKNDFYIKKLIDLIFLQTSPTSLAHIC